jgi:hypothetical protein
MENGTGLVAVVWYVIRIIKESPGDRGSVAAWQRGKQGFVHEREIRLGRLDGAM